MVNSGQTRGHVYICTCAHMYTMEKRKVEERRNEDQVVINVLVNWQKKPVNTMHFLFLTVDMLCHLRHKCLPNTAQIAPVVNQWPIIKELEKIPGNAFTTSPIFYAHIELRYNNKIMGKAFLFIFVSLVAHDAKGLGSVFQSSSWALLCTASSASAPETLIDSCRPIDF